MSIATRWFNPGPKVYWRGRWFDEAFVLAMSDQERQQGFKEYFYQGSYNKGVGASAGTHDKGGTADKQSRGTTDRQRSARRGIVWWPRTKAQGFPVHDHGVMMWANTAAPSLKAQMFMFVHGYNGLIGNHKDDSGVRNQFRHYLDWRQAMQVVPPNCYIDGVEKSRMYGKSVRPYNSVRLMQTALNKIYDTHLLVDGVLGKATLAQFNKFRLAAFGAAGATGSIGAISLKLLFIKAGMKVNVWDKQDTEGGKIQ